MDVLLDIKRMEKLVFPFFVHLLKQIQILLDSEEVKLAKTYSKIIPFPFAISIFITYFAVILY